MSGRPFDVAIVGGGPAGATLGALLARAGARVAVLEQAPAWRWRACGVFASPAAVRALRRVGLDEGTLTRVARPIPAMRLETPAGTRVRLDYGDGNRLLAPAVGFDRAGLDPALLDLAVAAGADVRPGVTVRSVSLPAPAGQDRRPRLGVVNAGGGRETIAADTVIGADGPRSVVARAAGVVRAPRLGRRAGLSFHVPDAEAGSHDARMVVRRDAYVGIAPVPGGRLNVGIVLTGRRLADLRAEGSRAMAAALLAEAGLPFDPCDAVVGAWPLGARVSRRAGAGWLLVGDAGGFLDPFTGEGIHRAIVSAELAAAAVIRDAGGAPAAYARSMDRRFRAKDGVSALVQAFLARPGLFEYAARRLEARRRVRETMGLVIGDLVPATRGLDPRFLAALLRP